MSGLLELTLLALTLLVLCAWFVVTMLSPSSIDSSASSPSARTWRARWWLYAPLWVPLLLLSATWLPNFIDAADHCLQSEQGHHHHLCMLHPPHASGAVFMWLLPLIMLVAMNLRIAQVLHRMWREGAMIRTLSALGKPGDLGSDILELELDEPFALTVGALRPKILLSAGLRRSVSQQTLDAVIAHERAHIARHDTRLAPLDHLAASLFPAIVSRPLLDTLLLAREQACDASAAHKVGGPLVVAHALTQVARLQITRNAPGLSVCAGSLEARVLFLLEPTQNTSLSWRMPALLFILILLGAGPIHSAVELMLSSLLH